jgi:hypothetical protein
VVNKAVLGRVWDGFRRRSRRGFLVVSGYVIVWAGEFQGVTEACAGIPVDMPVVLVSWKMLDLLRTTHQSWETLCKAQISMCRQALSV